MNFKELKSSYILYVFDKKNMACKEGKVISVSLPRFESKVGQTPRSVVDVSVELDGKTTTYVFPDDASKAYNGDFTFATDKNDIVADVRAIKRASEQAIADYDKHKETVTLCDNLLGDLDTEFKEKQKLESRLDKMEDMMTAIMSKLNTSVSQ